MENKMDKTFEEWYDAFYEAVSIKGYSGPIDRDAFREEWEQGIDPYESAENFVKEMNDD